MGILPRTPVRVLSGDRVNRLDGYAIIRYMSDFDRDDQYAVREFWRAYARRRTLIDFSSDFGPYSGRQRYGYDWNDGTYWYQSIAGRREIVPMQSIKLDIERFAKNMCELQRQYMTNLMNGSITTQQWYDSAVRVMKLSYRAISQIAIGSHLDMTAIENQRWLDTMVRQVESLNGFTERIQSGTVPIDGRLLLGACALGRRLSMVFEDWKLWQAKMQGKTMGRRILTHAEHCHDTSSRRGCVELARLGFVPIENMVPIGEAACYSGCRCGQEFK